MVVDHDVGHVGQREADRRQIDRQQMLLAAQEQARLEAAGTQERPAAHDRGSSATSRPPSPCSTGK
jgi:hypothetical protein